MSKNWMPRVARDDASLFTEAQRWAIESLRLRAKEGERPYQELCEALGITLEHPPEDCPECGEPINGGEGGLCAECRADQEQDELAAEVAAGDELRDWENGRGV